ncbi:MAG: hypothetical protein ACRCTQ_05075 [Brevinemataceae bacterium]
MEIQKLAKEAEKLRNKLIISEHKKTIKHVFEITNTSKKGIKICLAVIDSLYTTQAYRNPCLLDDLAQKISQTPDLENEIKKFADEKPSKLSELISMEHGAYSRDNKDDSGKQAKSLISKYCYFLTDYKFPIYDSLVKTFINKLSPIIDIKINQSLFKKIIKIKQYYNISFDELDCIAWLYGKISKKNTKGEKVKLYGIDGKVIVNRKEFEKFTESVDGWISDLQNKNL